MHFGKRARFLTKRPCAAGRAAGRRRLKTVGAVWRRPGPSAGLFAGPRSAPRPCAAPAAKSLSKRRCIGRGDSGLCEKHAAASLHSAFFLRLR